jgi:hypothetical protein
VFNLDCNALGALKNIANAYERQGDRQNAIFALEAYLARNPTGPDADTIKKRIENLRSFLAPPASASASTSTSAAPSPSLSASAAPTIAPTVTPPVPVKPYGAAPWVTIGLGGVSLVAGAILLPVGLGAVSDAKGAGKCSPYPDDPNRFFCPNRDIALQATTGQNQVLAGKIALGAGAAAVVGGLVWELVANKPVLPSTRASDAKKDDRTRVTPVVGPGTGGVVVQGVF